MATQPRFGFAVEYVKDIEAAKRFYTDVLGLQVQREAPTFVGFENFAIASDEPLGGGDETELYWLVDDAQAAFDEISTRAQVSMPMRELPYGRVFAVKDLDGKQRFILEFAGERPSRPV
jgi:predicted enzyme related to lactoylglutathione lyase